MKKYFTAFMMSMTMFCAIPCPFHKWDDESRPLMTLFLPLVGVWIGILWTLCAWLLRLVSAPALVAGALLCAFPFLITGGMHMDGFLDVVDAKKSWRDLEERRRILKDPHAGAFAVICLVIMLIVFTGAMADIAEEFSIKSCSLLVVIFTASRTVSAREVIMRKPMSTSQYSQLDEPGRARDTIPAIVILVVVLGICELIMSDMSWWALIAELYSNIIALTVMVAAFITCSIDCRKLGGMNGDISGHMITISELFGVLVMALIL